MIEKIKKHKALICIGVLFLIVGVPLIIHLLFKIDTNILFFQAEWTAGDVLQYYASILAIIPTTLLSIVALHYTISSKIDDDKWKKKVSLSITSNKNISFYFVKRGSLCCYIGIEFENKGENYPEAALLRNISISKDKNYEKLEIPSYRKSYCKVINKSPNIYELNIFIDECPNDVYDDEIIDKEIKALNRGLITHKEFERMLYKKAELEIGLYCGNIVTPMKIILDMHYCFDDMYLLEYRYLVDKNIVSIKSPLLAEDFEKEVELARENIK